ncbi:hypothetical protein CSAL01_12330 [Colletotrichum salicis]|uniref:Uncharacterized protein n=1 Tax=Colletotrichum salicis TaxID=1209931 RepID=A0A135ULQ3_9PEZI|nr:hypothetical protein CSAL01_12330 [Colletotrichum salicis]
MEPLYFQYAHTEPHRFLSASIWELQITPITPIDAISPMGMIACETRRNQICLRPRVGKSSDSDAGRSLIPALVDSQARYCLVKKENLCSTGRPRDSAQTGPALAHRIGGLQEIDSKSDIVYKTIDDLKHNVPDSLWVTSKDPSSMDRANAPDDFAVGHMKVYILLWLVGRRFLTDSLGKRGRNEVGSSTSIGNRIYRVPVDASPGHKDAIR